MKSIDYIDKVVAEVDGADLATAYKAMDPLFVDVVIAPYKKFLPWMVQHGFKLVPPRLGSDAALGLINEEARILVVVQQAFGGKVATGFPAGWIQKITALVTAGFLDLDSPGVRRRVESRRKNPSPRYHNIGTLTGWKNALNGILLKDIGLGTWQLTEQRYEEWFAEGMRPSTAANIVIDGVSTGQIRRKYRRNRA